MIWHKTSDKLPDKNTRYAGQYGVSVIGWDEQEHIDAGCRPFDVSFIFENNCFMELTPGLNHPEDGDWIKAPWVTHWCEFPEVPEVSHED